MPDLPTNDDIEIGDKVLIEKKDHQGTGQLTEGIVKRKLTPGYTHPYGIMVDLESGERGRVKENLSRPIGSDDDLRKIKLEAENRILEKMLMDTDKKIQQLELDEQLLLDNPDFEDLDKKIIPKIEDALNEFKLDIPKYEDTRNEFKSTYRLDLKRFEKGDGTKTHSKDVEKEIPVTISAMANKEGGTLFIGIDDDGNVLGLENDYELLKNPNDDKFQRMIWQTIKNFIENMVYVSKLEVSLINKESKKMYIIKIPSADEPIFVHDDHTQESYVRIGSRSEKFSPSDFMKYCKTRFKE